MLGRTNIRPVKNGLYERMSHSMNLDGTCILLLLSTFNEKISQICFFHVLSFSQSSQVLKQSHETKVVGYCMIAKDK